MSFFRCLFSLSVAGALPAVAVVVTVNRVADYTTVVPITSISAGALDLSPREILDVLSKLPSSRPPEDIAAAKEHAPFSSLGSDGAVADRLDAILKASIRSVEIVQTEDGASATALTYLLNHRRFGLAFGGLPGLEYEVREDGSGRYGTDAAWLYWVPGPREGQKVILPYDPDGFRLSHTLAGIGRRLTLPGYEDIPPQIPREQAQWALANQMRSLVVSSNAVDRLTQTVGVLNAIVANLALPTNSSGFARGVGRQLSNDPALSGPEKIGRARDLLTLIHGEMLPREELQRDATVFSRDTLRLYLENRLPSLNGYNEPFKRAGFFSVTVRMPGTDYPYTSYLGGYATIEKPDTNPRVVFDNRVIRVTGKSNGTRESETFSVGELGGISFAGMDGNRLILGGPSIDFRQFQVFGFLDSDHDGRVEPETKRELFATDHFLGGAHLEWNPVTGAGLILDRGTRNLFGLEGSGSGGFPTGVKAVGSLGNDQTDLWRFKLSHDGNWALGYSEFSGAISRYSQHTESYYDPVDKQYQPLRLGNCFEESRVTPAAAGLITDANRPINFTGTSDTEYRLQVLEAVGWLDRATATTDPLGRGCLRIPGTDAVLKIGGYVRIARPDGSESSPEYSVTSEREAPEFRGIRRMRSGDLHLPFVAPPDSDVILDGGTSLTSLAPVDAGTTSTYGTGRFPNCLPDPLGNMYFWRLRLALAVAKTRPEFYWVPTGVRRTIYPAWNDTFPLGTEFRLDTPEGAAASLMLLVAMDPRTSAVLATAGTFSNTPLTYRLYQNAVFLAAQQAVVIPDRRRLFNPPVLYDSEANRVVPVHCLVLGGKHYPMAQFRLAFPDHCPDAHWHASIVFPLEGSPQGLIDPDPQRCGYGSYENVPREEFFMPFPAWVVYRRLFLLPILAGQVAASGEPFCGPIAAPRQ